jgi:hypothetical protein
METIKVKVIAFYTKAIETTVEIPISDLKPDEEGFFNRLELDEIAQARAQERVREIDPSLRLEGIDEIELISAPDNFEYWS